MELIQHFFQVYEDIFTFLSKMILRSGEGVGRVGVVGPGVRTSISELFRWIFDCKNMYFVTGVTFHYNM